MASYGKLYLNHNVKLVGIRNDLGNTAFPFGMLIITK